MKLLLTSPFVLALFACGSPAPVEHPYDAATDDEYPPPAYAPFPVAGEEDAGSDAPKD